MTKSLFELLVEDEGTSVTREIREAISRQDSGVVELEWNVWHVDVDVDAQRVALWHDSIDSMQTTLPLTDFLAEVDAVVARS